MVATVSCALCSRDYALLIGGALCLCYIVLYICCALCSRYNVLLISCAFCSYYYALYIYIYAIQLIVIVGGIVCVFSRLKLLSVELR